MSINEVINPVCILLLSVGLILLQCQTTADEYRGDAAVAWLLWLCVWWHKQPPCSVCHFHLGPWYHNTTIKPFTASHNHCHRSRYGNEINKWGEQFCCYQLFARGVKGCGCRALTRLLVPSSCVGRRGETLTFNASEALTLSVFEVKHVLCHMSLWGKFAMSTKGN